MTSTPRSNAAIRDGASQGDLDLARCDPAAATGLDRGCGAARSRHLRRRRPHPDAGARRRDEPPVAGGRLLAPVRDRRRVARRHGRAARDGVRRFTVSPRSGSPRRSSTSRSSRSGGAGAPIALRKRSRSPATCACRCHARSRPVIPPEPSRSRPASATCRPRPPVPLRALAALVAYSRVHTGVHYPGDVLAGALIGTTLAQVTTHGGGRLGTRIRGRSVPWR